MKNTYFFISLLIAVFSCTGDEEPYIFDFEQSILGKWELVENTFGAVDRAPGYFQYKKDSVRLFFNYEQAQVYQEKYWLSDSLLYVSFSYMDEFDTIVFEIPYKYTFINYNTLKLEMQIPALNPLAIYKRMD